MSQRILGMGKKVFVIAVVLIVFVVAAFCTWLWYQPDFEALISQPTQVKIIYQEADTSI